METGGGGGDTIIIPDVSGGIDGIKEISLEEAY